MNNYIKCSKCDALLGVEFGEIEVEVFDRFKIDTLKEALNRIIKNSKIMVITGNPLGGVVVVYRKIKVVNKKRKEN
jgi:hypothetical protein